jgi:hypothetical protein
VIPAKPVVTNARAFYTTRAATGAAGTRRFLRPLFSRDQFPAQLGRITPREREAVSWHFRVEGCLKFESERMIEPWLARRPKPQNGEVRLRSRLRSSHAGHASPSRLAWPRHAKPARAKRGAPGRNRTSTPCGTRF